MKMAKCIRARCFLSRPPLPHNLTTFCQNNYFDFSDSIFKLLAIYRCCFTLQNVSFRVCKLLLPFFTYQKIFGRESNEYFAERTRQNNLYEHAQLTLLNGVFVQNSNCSMKIEKFVTDIVFR